MNHISRREFLFGAAAFGLGGWRLFAMPPGWKHGGTPNLVLGVVSGGIHPNDWGMVSLVKVYGNAVKQALRLPKKAQTK